MITVILKGGLGNQMFQYAFAKNISVIKNEEVVFDTSFLDCRIPVKYFTYRNYELDLFGVKERKVSTIMPNAVYKYLGYPITKIKSIAKGGYISEGKNPYIFDDKLYEKALKAKKSITLEGFWNNYKYFEANNELIKNIFDTDKLYDKKYEDIEKDIVNSNSVSISIRRGDYLNPKHKDVFVQLDENYYGKAIDLIRQKVEKPKFYVFSYDDPEWAKDTLKLPPKECVILDKNYIGDRFKTFLRLISLCKHNIISNSSFAFWGAYLNRNSGAIRIAPGYWMPKYRFEAPKDWLVL